MNIKYSTSDEVKIVINSYLIIAWIIIPMTKVPIARLKFHNMSTLFKKPNILTW